MSAGNPTLFTGSSSLQHCFAAARTTDAALRVARAQHNSKSSSPLISLELGKIKRNFGRHPPKQHSEDLSRPLPDHTSRGTSELRRREIVAMGALRRAAIKGLHKPKAAQAVAAIHKQRHRR